MFSKKMTGLFFFVWQSCLWMHRCTWLACWI